MTTHTKHEMLWIIKAHEIISKLSSQAYYKANFKNGIQLKKHVPYSIPEEAQELIECIKSNDELKAKQLFNYNYKIQNL